MIPNLLISVASTEVKPAQSLTEFPERVGETIIHTNVTEGKAGGLCEDDKDLYKTTS